MDKIFQYLRKVYPFIESSAYIQVRISEQLLLYIDGKSEIVYPISTSKYGVSCLKDSNKTPTGAHIVSEKIGDKSDIYQIFKGRQETNKNAEPILKPITSDEDNICSRIIWLDGLEEGHNKGGNVDSKSRYIYIHGTHEEGLIGTPASHGCIRMKNKDVIELYEKVSINTLVFIMEKYKESL
tara:strand:- start:3558 stop:4103 length:546 start_codon:yes stop_codon:yes gene_type:complete